MDLNTVTSYRFATSRADLALGPGEKLLGGGTWLFSEPQPAVTGLVDLSTMGWPDLEISHAGLRIAATCTIATLVAFAEGRGSARRTGRLGRGIRSRRPRRMRCWRPSRSGTLRPSAATSASRSPPRRWSRSPPPWTARRSIWMPGRRRAPPERRIPHDRQRHEQPGRRRSAARHRAARTCDALTQRCMRKIALPSSAGRAPSSRSGERCRWLGGLHSHRRDAHADRAPVRWRCRIPPCLLADVGGCRTRLLLRPARRGGLAPGREHRARRELRADARRLAHEVRGERRAGRGTSPRPGSAADAAARARPRRGEEGLRRRRLRRMHGAARRRARALLHRSRAARLEVVSVTTAAGLADGDGCTRCRRRFVDALRLPVRLLHAGMAVTASALDREDLPDLRPADQGQPLPLHGLPVDPRRRSTRAPCEHRRRRRPRDQAARRRAVGRRPPPRRGRQGLEPYTFDSGRPRPAHAARARAARTPTPASRAIDTADGRALPGVVDGLHPPGRPGTRYSTARHESRWTTPTTPACSTMSCGHVGQRVAAVVAETAAAAEAHAASSRSSTRCCPPSSIPSAPGARARRCCTPTAPAERPRRGAGRNVVAPMHDGVMGDVEAALAASAVTVSGTWRTSRVSATRNSRPTARRLARRRRPAGRAHQHPGAVPDARRALRAVRPAARAGPGAHRPGRAAGSAASRRCSPRTSSRSPCCARPPVAYEMTPRRRVHDRTPCGTRCASTVELGADADGVLTAMRIDVLSDTGAYGNHGPRRHVPRRAPSRSSVYRCAGQARRRRGRSTRTTCRPGAFRGYGLGQVSSASSRRWTSSPSASGIDPFELRRINARPRGRPAASPTHDEAEATSICGPTAWTSASTSSRRARRPATASPAPTGPSGGSARAWPSR